MKKIIFSLLVAGWIIPAVAQETTPRNKREERKQRINAIAKQEEEGVITFRKHTVFGGKLFSDGYGIFLEMARAQSVRRSLLFQLELSERKHAKEEKQQPYPQSTPNIAYKINFLYPVRLGVQQQFLFGNKGNKNGVAVTGNIGGGFTLGLLRPYMVEVNKGNAREYVAYHSADSLLFLRGGNGPNIGTGWKGVTVTPGFYVKPAVRFDYGKFNETVSAIETGVVIEFFTKKVEQMVYSKNKNLFFSAYFAIMFGKRK
jgi:hypothetical protein